MNVEGSTVSPADGDEESSEGGLAGRAGGGRGRRRVSVAVESSLLQAVSPERATRTAVAAAARRTLERMPSSG